MSIQCSTMVMTKVRDILELPRRKNQGILGDWAQPGHSQWVACGMGILHYISPFFKVRRGHPGEARTWSCPRVFTKTGISFDNSKVSVCTSELVCNLHRLFPVKLPLLLSILIPNRHMRWVAMLTLPLVFAFGGLRRCGVSSENSTGNGNAMVPWLKRHWVGWLAEWLVIPLIPLIWVELYAAIYMMVMVGLDGNAWCWAKQLSNVWIVWQVTHKCWIKTKRDSSWIGWVGQGPCSWGVFCRDGLVGRDGSKLGTSGPDLQNSGTRLHPTMS